MPPRFRTIAALAGLICLVVIVYATLSPLEMRPETGEPANVERFLAFMALAGAFVIAWPRRWALILVLVLAGGGALEAAQNLTPDRHGRPADFLFKAAGALAGVAGALAADRLARMVLVWRTGR